MYRVPSYKKPLIDCTSPCGLECEKRVETLESEIDTLREDVDLLLSTISKLKFLKGI